MLNVKSAEIYVELLKNKKEDGLYRHIIAAGIKRSIKVDSPEVEILDLSDSFFTLYRRTNEENYYIIGRILRRAAHTLYRQFMKSGPNKIKNNRFLQLVK